MKLELQDCKTTMHTTWQCMYVRSPGSYKCRTTRRQNNAHHVAVHVRSPMKLQVQDCLNCIPQEKHPHPKPRRTPAALLPQKCRLCLSEASAQVPAQGLKHWRPIGASNPGLFVPCLKTRRSRNVCLQRLRSNFFMNKTLRLPTLQANYILEPTTTITVLRITLLPYSSH